MKKKTTEDNKNEKKTTALQFPYSFFSLISREIHVWLNDSYKPYIFTGDDSLPILESTTSQRKGVMKNVDLWKILHNALYSKC